MYVPVVVNLAVDRVRIFRYGHPLVANYVTWLTTRDVSLNCAITLDTQLLRDPGEWNAEIKDN